MNGFVTGAVAAIAGLVGAGAFSDTNVLHLSSNIRPLLTVRNDSATTLFDPNAAFVPHPQRNPYSLRWLSEPSPVIAPGGKVMQGFPIWQHDVARQRRGAV